MQTFLPKNKPLNTITLISLVIFLLIHFFSDKIPSLVDWGQDFEDLIYRLSFSLIPSYLFYFIVVHQKSNKDKQNLKSVIKGFSENIESEYQYIIKSMIKKAFNLKSGDIYIDENGDSLNLDKIRLETFKSVLSKIKPNSRAPAVNLVEKRWFNWVEFFISKVNYIEQYVNNLILISPHLETEHIEKLYNIMNSNLVRVIKEPNFKDRKFEDDDLIYLAEFFFDFQEAIKNHTKYYLENISK